MNDDITRPSDVDLSRIGALLGDRAVRDEPLGTYTTYRVGGPAAIFVRATGVEDLHAVARALARVPVPVLVLGRGSNTLVADAGFRGLVVLLGPFAERVAVPEPGSPPVVTVGAHASLPVVARRFEHRGTHGGCTFVDDYAHLPAEIAAKLAGVRSAGGAWRRVVAVFQPNRYHRMATLSPEYRDAFVDADVAVVTEIYASGTAAIPGVSGAMVVEALRAAHQRARVEWIPERGALVE